ncbi:hypothetical protein MKW98_023225 [Papaver atlanticum]|uniref:SKP1-like protein n=1 Tax=Papaver atlanticum TaxID=357466 RepID=A0AAD4T9I0_9MAGN|nr:hypothetical protein MKW98_023225 [Papaver atlanticum]
MASSSTSSQDPKLVNPKTDDDTTTTTEAAAGASSTTTTTEAAAGASSTTTTTEAAAAAASSTTTEAAAASSSTAKKIIILKSSENEDFEVEESVALLAETIKHMIDDGCADTFIPLPNVSSKILAKVLEFLKEHGRAEKKEDNELKEWNDKYTKDMDRATLFDVILAANYLSIKSLLDVTCEAVAVMIKDMKVEEVREIFNIKNDFTPEEEAAVRAENAWAFE